MKYDLLQKQKTFKHTKPVTCKVILTPSLTLRVSMTARQRHRLKTRLPSRWRPNIAFTQVTLVRDDRSKFDLSPPVHCKSRDSYCHLSFTQTKVSVLKHQTLNRYIRWAKKNVLTLAIFSNALYLINYYSFRIVRKENKFPFY